MDAKYDIHVFWFDRERSAEPPETGLMRLFGIDAGTAQDLVQNVPRVVKRGLAPAEAEHFRLALTSLGALAEVHPHEPKGSRPRARPSIMPPDMDVTTQPELSLPPPSSEFDLPSEPFRALDEADTEKTPTRSYMPPEAKPTTGSLTPVSRRPVTDLASTVAAEDRWLEPAPSAPAASRAPADRTSDPLIERASDALLSSPPAGMPIASEPPPGFQSAADAAAQASLYASAAQPGNVPAPRAPAFDDLQLDDANSFLEGQHLPGSAVPSVRARKSSVPRVPAVKPAGTHAPVADPAMVEGRTPPAWSSAHVLPGDSLRANAISEPPAGRTSLPPRLTSRAPEAKHGITALTIGFALSVVAATMLIALARLPTDMAAVVLGAGGAYWILLGLMQLPSRGFYPTWAGTAACISLAAWAGTYALRGGAPVTSLTVADAISSGGQLTVSADRTYNIQVQRLTFLSAIAEGESGRELFQEFAVEAAAGSERALDFYGEWRPTEQGAVLRDLSVLRNVRMPIRARSRVPGGNPSRLLLPENATAAPVLGGWLSLQEVRSRGTADFGGRLYDVRGKFQLDVQDQQAAVGEISGTAVLATLDD